ncbi:RNA polymerase sigma factor [Parapedobacter indicus]|uniref:RNA polymerase sigma-70 factor, ECF subfamily n=1 Tax=Parapedobacter indicus TaxID=1477437 RepID=A0A1I3CT71_9SPHI|nr:RNA polymerase sigma-70 factor [Parapedobacter indicus]PPL04383.1 RNA polymerase sigma-70 factor (ECF subfamily) [Parapedobacter indicus]SFH77538.1 RNA polymerase sigma-70 factor, ECF subfamily [Parapedobacter indicus]
MQSEGKIRILLSQLRDGSECAFEQLYHMHSNMLLANIRSLVKDREVSCDILQDLYVKVWEYRHSIDPSKSYEAFLFTMARNLVYDYLRKTARDRKKRVELLNVVLESYPHVEEYMMAKEQEGLLVNAVNQLPEQCRKVYTLSKLEGKSHQEISHMLCISLATVNNHMVNANRKVRSFLLHHKEVSLMILLYVVSQSLKF